MIAEPAPDAAIAQAELDRDGLLVSADPAIAALNDRAGGRLGAPLAVPGLARAARLAGKLGIPVSRQLVVADLDADLDLWVRAEPVAAGVRLTCGGWREERVAPPSEPIVPGAPDADADLRWETDAALRLTFVSITAGRRLGIDALALLGRPVTALFALDETDTGALPLLDAVARRRAVVDQPARLRENGRHVTLSATPRAGDRFTGYVGTARLLADAVQPGPGTPLAAGFTDGLDRALRHALTRIIGAADTIHAGADGPVQQEYVDYAADIAHAGRHLLGLVDDLVDMEAIEQPDFALARDPIDLADVARRAAGLLQVRAGNAGVAIARPLPALSVPAVGDFRRALQVMVNLIGNAVRYSAEGGVVTITVTSRAGRAVAVVDDQGKGIAAEDQARIFDKFERVDPHEPGGNGLGLYIARRLARSMAGDLAVESAPGEGARFAFTLPAEAARAENQHQA